VMVHGWPDTLRLWAAQWSAFPPHVRCARLTLPGFGPGEPRRAVTLDELTERLAEVLLLLSPDRPVILMLHDWGCLFGYHLASTRPALVSRIVGVDVGDGASREFVRGLGPKRLAMIFGYQAWLALAWALGRVWRSPADGMTRAMARWLRCPTAPAQIHAGMNYPYHLTWTGRHGGYRHLRAPRPGTHPMLFVYGRRKPLNFHTRAWAEAVAAQPGGRVAAMEAGHWMMVSQPEAFNRLVLDWLQAR